MGRVVLDSSILIALFDETDAHHEAVKRRLEKSDEQYEISVLTITEAITAPMKVSAQSEERIRGAIAAGISLIHPVNEQIAVIAAQVRVKTGLKTVDAIISATATAAESELWTCDQKLAKAHKGAVLIS